MDNGHVSKFFDFINVDITLPREKENYLIKQVLRTNGKYAGKERESRHSIRCRQYRQEADRKVRAILMFPEHDPLSLT